ncbi:MAG TPA: GrpB family protein [Anaerolineaceae bacterium]|nr:GrpB family protein [Anaerolineaceae bacterium]
MISIVPYQPIWPEEFLTIARPLRQALGDLALRIDHIGSTAVPGLAAKDRIDIQVTVPGLTEAVERALNRAGYERLEGITQDHVPPGEPSHPDEWGKWIFKPPENQRLTNVHVRVAGRPNQRYPLLFRDYLRANPAAAEAYARVKTALARYHAGDVVAYYDIKDPVCDIIFSAAEVWAAATGWLPGPSDC